MVAYVILPDHSHLLIEPLESSTISIIMAATKAEYSIWFRAEKGLSGTAILRRKGFYDHMIRDGEDLRRHID